MTTGFNGRTSLLAQGGGPLRSAGLIFALPVLDGEAIVFGKLGETLRISRGRASTSLRVLKERAFVRRVTRLGVREDHLPGALGMHAAMRASALRRVDAARADIDPRIAALARDGDAKATSRSDGSEDDGPAVRPEVHSSSCGSIGQGAEAVLGRDGNGMAGAQ